MFYIDQDQPSNGEIASGCETSFLFEDNTSAISSNVQTFILKPDGSSKIIKMGFQWKDRFTINSIWGTSSNDFYVVGNNGNIAHYDGKNWQKIESGTTTSLDDLWGTDDGKTIWACGRDPNNLKSVFVKYENGACTTLWERDGMVPVPPYGNGVYSVWMNNQTLYKSTSHGIYMERGTTNIEMPNNKLRYFRVIRGNGGNDLLTIDDQSVWHYNGENWEALTNDDPNLILFGGSINGNTAVVVGSDFSIGLGAAMISVGRR